MAVKAEVHAEAAALLVALIRSQELELAWDFWEWWLDNAQDLPSFDVEVWENLQPE